MVQADYYTEREGRYVLPVRADAHLRVPGIVLGSSASGATLFVEPEELTASATNCASKKRRHCASRQGWRDLSGYLASDAEHVRIAQRRLQEADVLRRAGALPRKPARSSYRWRRQLASTSRAPRHPLLALRRPVVANDIAIEAGARSSSRANAGGKTVALKTLGLSR